MSNFREAHRLSSTHNTSLTFTFTQTHTASVSQSDASYAHSNSNDTPFCEDELLKAGFESEAESLTPSTLAPTKSTSASPSCSSLRCVISSSNTISTTELGSLAAERKWAVRTLSQQEMGTLTANLIIYHDLLSIWWYLLSSRRETLRSLLFADYAATLKDVGAAVQLLDTLKRGDTADLYDSYHATRALSDIKFVFAETRALINNERFFAFRSFMAQILFVCEKLELGAFFDSSRALPQRYADWKALYVQRMEHFLSHTLKVEDAARQQIAFSLANVVDRVPREHSIVLLERHVAMLVNHGHHHDQDGCPVRCNLT